MGHRALKNIRKIFEGLEVVNPVTSFLSSRVDITHHANGGSKFCPTPKQTMILNIIEQHDKCGIVVPRQSGLSSAVMGYFLYDFVSKPHQSMAITADRFTAGKHTLDIFREMLYSITPLQGVPSIPQNNRTTIQLDNGSRIMVCNGADDFRGRVLSHVFYDNFLYDRNGFKKFECYYPTLAKSSKLVLGSSGTSPNSAFPKFVLEKR